MKKHLRNDLILVGVILVLAVIGLIINYSIDNSDDNLVAYVYHGEELVYTINLEALGEEVVEYKVEGDVGEMIIEAKHNAIRVAVDSCRYHYCSNQGFVSSTNRPIVCLPNRVYIEIVGNSSSVDLTI